MKRSNYTDYRGRKYLVMMPEGEENFDMGTILGPPDVVDLLDLPEEMATRLHNELFNRKLFTYKDVSKRPVDVQGAIQKVLRLDVAMISTAYHQFEKEALSIEEV